MVEVELKFPISEIDDFRKQLAKLNIHSGPVSHQQDVYFNHSLQDFAKEDLALRIRSTDSKFEVTFKGPNRDNTAKIRDETEVALPDENAARGMKAIFEGCGFFAVAEVVKRREACELEFKGQTVQVCIDEVRDLGAFVELEIIVAGSEQKPDRVAAAKACLLDLADQLGLSGPITTSYLELILG